MKAIHVGNTRDSRLYYLIESDDQSTGAVVVPNQPAVYVDFFAYVSKKGSIERVMDSEFHKFFWTGHTGSLSERWEQTFIHRVTSPREMALSGVEILTEFKEKKKPSRVTQLNERANRAVEYKALIGAGLNEKAFARRGVRRIGRGIGEAATGGVRGFRRGVRFDPDAEDADGDGFVQEGTQYARRAVASAAAGGGRGRGGSGGMRSGVSPPSPAGRASFLPPRPPPVPGTGRATPPAQRYIDWLNDPWVVEAMMENPLSADDWNSMSLSSKVELMKQAHKLYDGVMERLGQLTGGNDAEDILATYEGQVQALQDLIGGREIRTFADAKEVALIVHPLFQHGESEFNILTEAVPYTPFVDPANPTQAELALRLTELDRRQWRDGSEELTPFELGILVSTLTMLKASPRFKKQKVWIREADTGENAEYIGSVEPMFTGAAGYEYWQTASTWGVDENATTGLLDKIKAKMKEMVGGWNESGLSSDPLADSLELTGITGMEGEDTRQVMNRSFVARLSELIKIRPDKDTGDPIKRTGRVVITYGSPAKDHGTKMVEDHIKGSSINPGTGLEEYFNVTAARFAGEDDPYMTAQATLATLFAYADGLPPEEKARVLRKAAVIHGGSTLVHETGGHGTHDANTLAWALDRVGPEDPTSTATGDIRYAGLLKSTINRIVEKIKDQPLARKTTMDTQTEAAFADTKKGLAVLLGGMFGIAWEDIAALDTNGNRQSLFDPAGGPWHDKFDKRGGIHGVLRHGTDTQKQRVRTWLSQPVMDPHGNPIVANAGLAKYFEELKEVALKEWGIDLTIGAGEPMSLAHVMFGISPHEDGLYGLGTERFVAKTADAAGNVAGSSESPLVTGKKGPWAWITQISDTLSLRVPSYNHHLQFRARKARTAGTVKKPDGTLVRWHLTEHVVVRAGNPDEVNIDSSIVPQFSLIRRRGLPAVDTTKIVKTRDEGGAAVGIKTTAVSPEDVAPLLDAVAHVAHVFPQLEDHELTPTDRSIDEVLDQLENITFDSVPDVEIGLTGKKLSDYMEELSPEQEAAFLEEMGLGLVTEMLLSHLPTETGTGASTARRVSSKIQEDRPKKELSKLVERLAMASEWSDDLSSKTVKLLEEIVDAQGIDDISAYSGKVTGYTILDTLLGNTRHEMIAELMTSMVYGLDLSMYKGTKRIPLNKDHIAALLAFYRLWHPDSTPKIRTNGKLVPLDV